MVGFPRTVSYELQSPTIISLKSPTLSKRKSCLKRSSFEMPETTITRRKSKLECISAAKIDGHVLGCGKRKPFKEDREDKSDSGDSSEHNIFGDNKMVLSTGWEQKLGLSPSPMERSMPIGGLEKKKSILKQNSFALGSGLRKSSLRNSKVEESPKLSAPPFLPQASIQSKKSVMFNCTM